MGINMNFFSFEYAGYDGAGIKDFEPEFPAGSGETEGYQGDFCPGFGGSYLLVLGT